LFTVTVVGRFELVLVSIASRFWCLSSSGFCNAGQIRNMRLIIFVFCVSRPFNPESPVLEKLHDFQYAEHLALLFLS
jgi:hypothetical protein